MVCRRQFGQQVLILTGQSVHIALLGSRHGVVRVIATGHILFCVSLRVRCCQLRKRRIVSGIIAEHISVAEIGRLGTAIENIIHRTLYHLSECTVTVRANCAEFLVIVVPVFLCIFGCRRLFHLAKRFSGLRTVTHPIPPYFLLRIFRCSLLFRSAIALSCLRACWLSFRLP